MKNLFRKDTAWSIGKVLAELQYGYARSVGGGATV